MAKNDYTGMRFGRLVATGEAGRSKHGGNIIWSCLCDCGNSKDVLSTSLRLGDTQSCGCMQSEMSSSRMTKHGHAKGKTSPTYNSWAAMVQRCTNITHPEYVDYGARGIAVCNEWLDFQKFLSHMGERPNGMTIDRIDNEDGYRPGNCRWATAVVQANNRRPRRYWKKPGIEILEIRA